ncbi:MAG: hypothetical protein ACE141_14025 [Bryobacteraceae bacterium]
MLKNAQTTQANHKEPIPLLFNKSLDQMRSVGARGGRARGRNLRARRRGCGPAPRPPIPIAQNTESTAEAISLLDAQFPWLIGAERKETRSRD